ncbi:MAG: protein-export chaperone SecB [Gammaproteobacteria bacterium]|nr:protein-export chaperone SecB [Gammaproteobacteria bacterium]MXY91637.1 protein-export chaperone SecB [Gammaproteobacteria bacterium]MYA35320.1 protein-export chaperone SecB [Gammaproteobacteria bacterium]MYG96052.1 protein-export chaperone SecB [Gammaproteobacteria bacterium]MYH84871.1 protein-export chaperone SecB [Gammaproteobacteria bacterium]
MAENEQNEQSEQNDQEAAPPEAAAQQQPQADPNAPQFALQRIYLKDFSFESPRSPGVFTGQWSPNINFEVKSRSQNFQENTYEVILTLTVEAKVEEETAFLVEVQQAGIFACANMESQQLEQILSSLCPNILFPYAREAIDSIVTKGSFPPLMLAPINFDAVYAEQKRRQAEQQPGAQPGGNGAGEAQATTQ